MARRIKVCCFFIWHLLRCGHDETATTRVCCVLRLLKERVIERDREIARLKHELAKQADGSLFDLKHDSADDCAGAIVANLSTHKVMNPADGILARLKKSQKPAG